MTKGTKTVDNRANIYYPSGSMCSSGTYVLSGYYQTKTWSGGDSPVRIPGTALAGGRWFTDTKGVKHFWNPYKPVKRGRGLPEHAYNMTFVSRTDGYGSYLTFQAVCNDYARSYFSLNSNWTFSPDPSITWSGDDDIALIAGLRKVLSGSTFNLGAFLGEGHESLNTIFDAATRIRHSYTALKHGRAWDAWIALVQGKRNPPRKPNSIHKTEPLDPKFITQEWLSSNWLAMQYGWKPLLGDAKDAAEFLAHHLEVPLQKSYRVTKKKLGGVVPNSTSFTGSGYSFNAKRIKAIVREQTTSQKLSELLNPWATAWETLPYSFVADWFIPIGDYLTARGLSSAFTGTYTVSFYRKLSVVSIKPSSSYLATHKGWLDSPNLFSSGNLSRTLVNELDVPMPKCKALNKVLSWTHAANAVALLTQLHR